ncbi:MAG TPA: hypothetical protein VFH31_13390, partial [Pyrinomonadaceae bacterium]|nr:hypothetical protein [Pyrinomonadaceae bacterium]
AIKRYWTKAPYHVQLELMETAGQFWRAEEPERKALIAVIEALPHLQNPFVSTVIMEALQQLNALEASEHEHQKDVRDQMQKLLSGPGDEESCIAVHHLYYAQFDHPLSTAYCEVVSQLSGEERRRFLMMAAKGVEDSHLFLSPPILDLASFKDPEAGEIINRWTQAPPPDSFDPQEAIEVFVIARIAVARLGCVLPDKAATDNPSANALAACGALLYWSNRVDVTEDVRRTACHKPLDVLRQHETGVAVDAIRHCHHVRSEGIKRLPGAASVNSSILSCFPEHAAEICAKHSIARHPGRLLPLFLRTRPIAGAGIRS